MAPPQLFVSEIKSRTLHPDDCYKTILEYSCGHFENHPDMPYVTHVGCKGRSPAAWTCSNTSNVSKVVETKKECNVCASAPATYKVFLATKPETDEVDPIASSLPLSPVAAVTAPAKSNKSNGPKIPFFSPPSSTAPAMSRAERRKANKAAALRQATTSHPRQGTALGEDDSTFGESSKSFESTQPTNDFKNPWAGEDAWAAKQTTSGDEMTGVEMEEEEESKVAGSAKWWETKQQRDWK
ncbi:uncharacterized protein LY89DRAFT_665653 [Mollisia scopiformis]|uniref:Uncharacterized protein n=1 Tax=Mollisia scopiformis TaxID=149040 RepID=A0A194XN69_MOLSC|nr:uncharacterized protein LY89DRAFT_665653 [Mollisia scopiformis]KUJ21207.1 hypothetical protein LY89DRAFT_665653 [Mollisia scopiformis]